MAVRTERALNNSAILVHCEPQFLFTYIAPILRTNGQKARKLTLVGTTINRRPEGRKLTLAWHLAHPQLNVLNTAKQHTHAVENTLWKTMWKTLMPLQRPEPRVRQPDRRRRAGLRQLVRERDRVVEALPGPKTVILVVKLPARPHKSARERRFTVENSDRLKSGRLNAPGGPFSLPGPESTVGFRYGSQQTDMRAGKVDHANERGEKELPGPETVRKQCAPTQKCRRESIYCGKLRPLKIRPLKRPGRAPGRPGAGRPRAGLTAVEQNFYASYKIELLV